MEFDDFIPPPFSKEKGDFYDTIQEMSRVSALSEEERMEYVAFHMQENDRRLKEENIARESRNEGIAIGLAEGRAEGQLKEKWETARILFNKNMSFEFISEITGLPIEDLKSKLSR